MGIVITVFVLFLFCRKVIRQKKYMRNSMFIGLVIVFLFSLLLNSYLAYAMKWEYGVPGADLRHYFDAAQALSRGESITKLSKIWNVFDLKLSHIGYMTYVVYIWVIAFMPSIVDIRFSLQLVYVIQAVVAVLASENIAYFFEDNERKKVKLFWIVLLNAGMLQQSSILMRDIWIVYFISVLMRECKENTPRIWKCCIMILLAFAMRSYTVLLTIPIFIAFGLKKKKLGIASCIPIVTSFFVGTWIIDWFASWANILWTYDFKFDINKIIVFLLYPNPINQAKIMFSGIEHSYHYVHGGNCAWVYFLLSYWNFLVYPFAIVGIFKCLLKKDKQEKENLFFWILIILSVVLIYGAFYDSTSEPRHKLMFLYGIVYLYNKGVDSVPIILEIIFFFMVTILFLGICAFF